jgi:hypothetical protein
MPKRQYTIRRITCIRDALSMGRRTEREFWSKRKEIIKIAK